MIWTDKPLEFSGGKVYIWFFICVLGAIMIVPLHFLLVEHLKLQERYGKEKRDVCFRFFSGYLPQNSLFSTRDRISRFQAVEASARDTCLFTLLLFLPV